MPSILRHTRLLVLCVSMLSSWVAFPATAQPSGGGDQPPLATLYALAAAKLLGSPSGQEVTILPTEAHHAVSVRARPSSGTGHVATAATAREVASLLRGAGYTGAQARAPESGSLRFVLGELRFEPAQGRASFARLAIRVLGAGESAAEMEVLLKREAQGWLVLKMEAADNIG